MDRACSTSEMMNLDKDLVKNLEGKNHLQDLGTHRRIISNDLSNSVLGCGIDSSGSGQSSVADSSEHGNEHSCSNRSKEILDHLSNY
jgi:hypothetical protein